MKEKNNDYIMMILVVFIILFFLGGFIYVQNLKGTSTDKSKKEEKHITESKTPMNQSDDPIEAETEVNNDENKQIDTVEVTDIVPTPTNGIQSEEDVIQYIENMESSVVNSSQKDTSDWKVKAKKLLVSFVCYSIILLWKCCHLKIYQLCTTRMSKNPTQLQYKPKRC